MRLPWTKTQRAVHYAMAYSAHKRERGNQQEKDLTVKSFSPALLAQARTVLDAEDDETAPERRAG
jgi:hypothetical protein